MVYDWLDFVTVIIFLKRSQANNNGGAFGLAFITQAKQQTVAFFELFIGRPSVRRAHSLLLHQKYNIIYKEKYQKIKKNYCRVCVVMIAKGGTTLAGVAMGLIIPQK